MSPEPGVPTTRAEALERSAECMTQAQAAGGLGDHGASWLARADGWMRLADALGQSSSSVTP